MECTKLGPTDIDISRICFGTLWVGGVEESDAIASVHRAIEKGINFIDTADIYGAGRSEEIVGNAIANIRSKVIASDKGITMAQLAIAWTLAQSGITSALVAAKSPQQIDENIPAADVKLNAEDLYRIDDVLS